MEPLIHDPLDIDNYPTPLYLDLPSLPPGALDGIDDPAIVNYAIGRISRYQRYHAGQIAESINDISSTIHRVWYIACINRGYHKFFLTRWIAYFLYGRTMAEAHAEIRSAYDELKDDIAEIVALAFEMQKDPKLRRRKLKSAEPAQTTSGQLKQGQPALPRFTENAPVRVSTPALQPSNPVR